MVQIWQGLDIGKKAPPFLGLLGAGPGGLGIKYHRRNINRIVTVAVLGSHPTADQFFDLLVQII